MMESTQRRLSEDANQLRGIPGDFQRLSRDGASSAEELREFVRHLHDKSPQEAMGEVAQSGLAQGMGVATVGFTAVLLVFTIVPYLFKDGEAQASKADDKKAPAAAVEAEPATENNTASAAATTADTGTPNLQKASKAMGIDETKKADPKVNPLEKNLDTLLDGVD